MARSPLTLAASVTSALPRVGVVGVAELSEGVGGRYDSAVVQLDDGRQVVVRAPVDGDTTGELVAEARALRALTPGVRALLPFRAPELLGETGIGDGRAIVVDFVPGYRVDAAHVPAGRGAATSIGAALAAVHALPLSILRTEGLPSPTADQLRDEVRRLLDRLTSTKRVPATLLERWRGAVDEQALWRFETAVVLGGVAADAFLLEDDEVNGPTVSGLLDWHGLAGGDPALDLRWIAAAPTAADDVYTAYAAASRRAPDGGLRARARLYAELEFAKWLLHGVDEGREDIVGDAVGLLTSLASGVNDDDLSVEESLDVDEAIALLDRVPSGGPAGADTVAADTSMQTDAYDPGTLSMFVVDDEAPDEARDVAPNDSPDDAPEVDGHVPVDNDDTAPIDLSAWSATRIAPSARPEQPEAGAMVAEDDDHEAEADRAARAALHRWASSGSE